MTSLLVDEDEPEQQEENGDLSEGEDDDQVWDNMEDADGNDKSSDEESEEAAPVKSRKRKN